MCCIEIHGPEKDIIHGLSSLCDPKMGLTFGAAAFLSGTREGRVTVFRRNNLAGGPIGLVTFLWRNGDTPEARTLWTWSHPAFCYEFLNELNATFAPHPEASLEHSGIKITLNKGKLNRFRLRGPSSYAVVSALLDAETRNRFNGSQSPGYVTAVEVRDPRMTLPQSRTRQSSSTLNSCQAQSVDASRSRLWDPTLRDQIAQLRKSFPDYIISQRRSQLLVPGTELPVQPEEVPIPLLIVNASYEGSGKCWFSY